MERSAASRPDASARVDSVAALGENHTDIVMDHIKNALGIQSPGGRRKCWKCGAVRIGVDNTWWGPLSIRSRDGKHYLVVIDANGCETEYEIWFCPYCGKKL